MSVEPRTIAELGQALRTGTTTAEAITRRCLQQIAQQNATINAFITVLADQAIAQAQDADRELAAGRDRGPLHGVPLSLKDLIDVAGAPTTSIRSFHAIGTPSSGPRGAPARSRAALAAASRSARSSVTVMKAQPAP